MEYDIRVLSQDISGEAWFYLGNISLEDIPDNALVAVLVNENEHGDILGMRISDPLTTPSGDIAEFVSDGFPSSEPVWTYHRLEQVRRWIASGRPPEPVDAVLRNMRESGWDTSIVDTVNRESVRYPVPIGSGGEILGKDLFSDVITEIKEECWIAQKSNVSVVIWPQTLRACWCSCDIKNPLTLWGDVVKDGIIFDNLGKVSSDSFPTSVSDIEKLSDGR